MIGAFHVLQSLFMFAVAAALALIAGRRREWRGGLAAFNRTVVDAGAS